MQLAYYLKVIQKRKWIILLTTLVATVVVALISLQTPPTYQATTRLRYQAYGGINTPNYDAWAYFDRLANTYSEILRSDLVGNQAKERLGLETLPNFELSVNNNTDLMRLDVWAENPELAVNVANTLAELLIQENQSGNSDITGELRDRLNTLREDINLLTDEMLALQNQVPRDTQQINDLQSRINSLEQNYTITLNTYNQATITQLAQTSALSILQYAEMPEGASSPGLFRNVAVGAVIGLLGGIALAFLMESLNPRLYTNQQTEALVGSPIVGKIPTIRRKHRNNVFGGDHRAAEAFRRLRTNLFAEQGSAPLSLMLVTSAVPREGKSTVAINLALSMAHSGRRVLLVDGDMIQPTIHKKFSLTNMVGLSDILLGNIDLKSAVQRLNGTELDVLTAGPYIPNSAELLSSENCDSLIEALLLHYEIVIFDGPALLAVTDSSVLAPHMNGVLWVVDRERVDQSTVMNALNQLKSVNAEIIGVVANRVPGDQSFSYYEYYRPSANGKTPKAAQANKTRVVTPNNHNGR